MNAGVDDTDRREPAAAGAAGSAAAAATAHGAPAAAATAAAPAVVRYPVEFSARAGEYFRIWIVNLALSVLTVGIYSAWAKVRKKRYLYAHTRIDGDSFEYRANPLAILKGRLIAVALFAGYSFGGQFSPLLGGLCALALLFAMPWLIVRSLAFNAWNSAYRNVRFRFLGRYGEPLKLIVGGGLATLFTLGLAYPWVKSRWTRFAVANHAFGATRATLGVITSRFYGIYLKALGLLVGSAMLLGVAAGLLGFLRGGAPRDSALVFFMAGVYLLYLLVYAYLNAQITNATWNAARLGAVRFESRLRGRDLTLLYLGNIVAVLCTLGLAIPWAVVRTLRYRAAHTALLASGGLAGFVAGQGEALSATGEEVGEMFDLDFSL